MLEGYASAFASRDLRFSTQEIVRFFDLTLTRSELLSVAAKSGGWPIALRVHRNSGGLNSESRVVHDFVESWLSSRFWRGFRAEDLELALDVGLVEWIDAELLAEVFDEKDTMGRLVRMWTGWWRTRPGVGMDGVAEGRLPPRQLAAAARHRGDFLLAQNLRELFLRAQSSPCQTATRSARAGQLAEYKTLRGIGGNLAATAWLFGD